MDLEHAECSQAVYSTERIARGCLHVIPKLMIREPLPDSQEICASQEAFDVVRCLADVVEQCEVVRDAGRCTISAAGMHAASWACRVPCRKTRPSIRDIPLRGLGAVRDAIKVKIGQC